MPRSLVKKDKKDVRMEVEGMDEGADQDGSAAGLRRSSRRRVEKSYAEVPDIILQSDDEKSPEDDDSDTDVVLPVYQVRSSR